MSIKSRVSETGRSMIEMLGVLAIVGVLTVGAISGYQRAMTKYRINKAVQEFGTTVNNILMYQKDITKLNFVRATTDDNALMVFAQNLELVPRHWYLEEGAGQFKDSYGGDFTFGIRGDGTKMYFLYRLKRAGEGMSLGAVRICQEIWMQVYKPLSGIIYHAHMNVGSNQTLWYGSEYCGPDVMCLDDITPDLIYQECARCINASKSKKCQITMDVK